MGEARALCAAVAFVVTLADGRLAVPPGPHAPAARPAAPGLPAGFVDLTDVAPRIALDLRYAGSNNFMGRPVRGYGAARCLLTKEAAAALAKAEAALEPRGFRLHVYDCYRPKRAIEDFMAWALGPPADARTPAHNPLVPKGELVARGYIAARSGHSRGSTVDLTLVSLATDPGRKPEAATPASDCRDVRGALAPDGTLAMGTTFDCFDERAHADDAGVLAEARRNRLVLRVAMEKVGFTPHAKEWWHFSLAKEPFPETAFDFPISPR